MSGLRFEDLRMPKKRFRADKVTRREDGKIEFESKAECIEQDKICAAALRRWARAAASRQRVQALDLATRLEGEKISRSKPSFGDVRTSLASRVNNRVHRIKLTGPLLELMEDPSRPPATVATLLPVGMWVPSDELPTLDAKRFKKQLENDLNRAGVTQADGWLFAGLDAEFDSTRGGYDFHWHLVVAGEKIDALENLRERPRYVVGRTAPHEIGLKELPRVQITRQPLVNLPEPITYAMKLRVYDRPTFTKRDGSIGRSHKVRRMKDEPLCQWLLWMDEHSLSDFIKTQGLLLTKEGLKPKMGWIGEYLSDEDNPNVLVILDKNER